MGDQVCVLSAGSDNQKIWYTNQCASMQFYDDRVVVTSEQDRSTPGIKTSMYLKANQRFCLRTFGQSYRQACAFVWVYLLPSKRRLIPNYTMLSSDSSGESCVDIEFCTPTSQKTHVQVFLGVLFTGPPKSGDQYVLQKMELTYLQSCTFPTDSTASPCPVANPTPSLPDPITYDAPTRADPYYDCYDTNGDDAGASAAYNATQCNAYADGGAACTQSSPECMGGGASPASQLGAPVSITELSNVCDMIISKLDANQSNSNAPCT